MDPVRQKIDNMFTIDLENIIAFSKLLKYDQEEAKMIAFTKLLTDPAAKIFQKICGILKEDFVEAKISPQHIVVKYGDADFEKNFSQKNEITRVAYGIIFKTTMIMIAHHQILIPLVRMASTTGDENYLLKFIGPQVLAAAESLQKEHPEIFGLQV